MLEIIICSKNIRIGLYITNIISLGLGGADSYGIEKVIVPAERIEMYRWRSGEHLSLLGGLTSVMKTTHEFMCFTNTSCNMIYM